MRPVFASPRATIVRFGLHDRAARAAPGNSNASKDITAQNCPNVRPTCIFAFIVRLQGSDVAAGNAASDVPQARRGVNVG